MEKVDADNPDPDQLAFLQAGAARVVVPVSKAYKDVLAYCLDTGEIWGGDDVPELTVASAPYVWI